MLKLCENSSDILYSHTHWCLHQPSNKTKKPLPRMWLSWGDFPSLDWGVSLLDSAPQYPTAMSSWLAHCPALVPEPSFTILQQLVSLSAHVLRLYTQPDAATYKGGQLDERTLDPLLPPLSVVSYTLIHLWSPDGRWLGNAQKHRSGGCAIDAPSTAAQREPHT